MRRARDAGAASCIDGSGALASGLARRSTLAGVGDVDLLTRRRVATPPLVRRGLHPNGELNQRTDADLLGGSQLLEHELVKGGERPLGGGLAEIGAICDGGDHLRL